MNRRRVVTFEVKVIQALFLDELRREFTQAGRNRLRFDAPHCRLEQRRFPDPSGSCDTRLW